MQTEVQRRLAEDGGPVFWSIAEIQTALNDGYAELSDATEWHEEHLNIDLLNDRPYYDLRTIIGDRFLAVRSAFDIQTNRWLLPTSVRQFDAHDRRWERVTGEPQRIIMRSLWWLGYWPRVQYDVGQIKQYYTSLPEPMVDSWDEPGFLDTFHYGCVWFALADLWAQDAETTRAVAAWTEYLAIELGLLRWVEGRAGAANLHGYGAIGSVAR